ncbi:anion exchange protein, partial [Ostertagia ostertagi]
MLGPTGHGSQYKEIGRAIATLMADEIFHDVAYKARNKEDLLDGVDEFLDQVTVLPPGEWDPTIRIEPPNQIPSQEKRKQVGQEMLLEGVEMSKGPGKGKEELEEEGHGSDPALKRTGRLFGGLILDIKRKAPHFLSDFTDALNLQCLATACFMYFALLAPIVTFGGLLEEATHQRMAAMENILGDYGVVLLGVTTPLEHCRYVGAEYAGTTCYPLYDKLLMSVLLTIGTFTLAITFKRMRNSCYFPSRVRQIFSDFAVMISIVIMTFIDMSAGVNTPKLHVPGTFRPTWDGRDWFIPPFDGNPFWTAPLAALPALLACILIFMDQQITTVIVNRKENKLKKGCGYHLDLLVLAILILIVGVLGLPIYVAATVLSINHINSLKVESDCKAPGEVAQFVGVREQRVTGIVTFVMIGLSVLITNFLAKIPMPVLYGVFPVYGYIGSGWYSTVRPYSSTFDADEPDTIYIRHVPIKKIHLFTAFQVGCLAVLWTVKSIKTTSLTFPIMLVVMVAVRKLMEKFFTTTDLKYLDDPMPDFHLRKKEDLKRRQSVETVDIELEDNQATIHAVKTEAHLHIPMASGNVIKIPLAAIQEPSHSINMTKEVNSSGMWKHISSRDSKNSLDKEMPKTAV